MLESDSWWKHQADSGWKMRGTVKRQVPKHTDSVPHSLFLSLSLSLTLYRGKPKTKTNDETAEWVERTFRLN